MINKTSARVHGSPLAASMLARLNRVCARYRSRAVRVASGLSEASFFRAKSGEAVHDGTGLMIERAVEHFERLEQAAE